MESQSLSTIPTDLESYRARVDELVDDMLGAVSAIAERRFDRFCAKATLEDGPVGALALGINMMVSDIAEAVQNAESERAKVTTILQSIPDPVITVDDKMRLTFLNQAACDLVGVKVDQVRGRPCSEVFATSLCGDLCPVRMAREGTAVCGAQMQMTTTDGRKLDLVASAATLVGQTGASLGAVEILRDVTVEKERERRLVEAHRAIREQMDMISNQQHTISELGTPVLDVWDGVLALPLVGALDSQRSLEVMERLLQAIVGHKTQFAILDLTGVAVVDTQTADHLIRITKAAGLLGTRCIVTGINPAVAQSIVELGIDLSGIITRRTLKDGLKAAIARSANPDRTPAR